MILNKLNTLAITILDTIDTDYILIKYICFSFLVIILITLKFWYLIKIKKEEILFFKMFRKCIYCEFFFVSLWLLFLFQITSIVII